MRTRDKYIEAYERLTGATFAGSELAAYELRHRRSLDRAGRRESSLADDCDQASLHPPAS